MLLQRLWRFEKAPRRAFIALQIHVGFYDEINAKHENTGRKRHHQSEEARIYHFVKHGLIRSQHGISVMQIKIDASCGGIGNTRFEIKNKISRILMKIVNNYKRSGIIIHAVFDVEKGRADWPAQLSQYSLHGVSCDSACFARSG
jgi:hypothetical protein